VVENLLCKYEALSSNSSPIRKRKKEGRKEKRKKEKKRERLAKTNKSEQVHHHQTGASRNV
jgi:hypothetical protein